MVKIFFFCFRSLLNFFLYFTSRLWNIRNRGSLLANFQCIRPGSVLAGWRNFKSDCFPQKRKQKKRIDHKTLKVVFPDEGKRGWNGWVISMVCWWSRVLLWRGRVFRFNPIHYIRGSIIELHQWRNWKITLVRVEARATSTITWWEIIQEIFQSFFFLANFPCCTLGRCANAETLQVLRHLFALAFVFISVVQWDHFVTGELLDEEVEMIRNQLVWLI